MRPIRSPADVVAMSTECKKSKDHLNKAFRNLLKEFASNYSSESLDALLGVKSVGVAVFYLSEVDDSPEVPYGYIHVR